MFCFFLKIRGNFLEDVSFISVHVQGIRLMIKGGSGLKLNLNGGSLLLTV